MAKSPRFPPSFAQRITWLGTMKNIPVRRVRSLVAAAHSHNCAHTCNISKPKSTGGYFAFSASPCLASCFLIVWFCSFGQVFFFASSWCFFLFWMGWDFSGLSKWPLARIQTPTFHNFCFLPISKHTNRDFDWTNWTFVIAWCLTMDWINRVDCWMRIDRNVTDTQ